MKKTILFLIISFSIQNTIAQGNENIISLKKIIDSIESNVLEDSKKITLLEQYIPLAKNNQSIMEGLILLGDVYRKLELYEKAYSLYSKSLLIAKKNRQTYLIARNYQRIGSTQLRIGDYQNSLENFTSAHTNFSKINDYHQMNLSQLNIATVQTIIGPIEGAVVTLKKAIIDKSLTNLEKSNALMSLGNVYLVHLDSPKKAIQYYEQSLKNLDPKKEKMMQVMLYQNIAESYIALKKYNLAIKYNKLSESILLKFPKLELQSTLHKFYAEIYQKNEQYKKAMYNFKLYHLYKDSLDKKSIQLKIKNNNTIQVTELFKKEAELHKKEIELKNHEIAIFKNHQTINKLKVFILSLLAISLFFLIFKIIKKNKEKVKNLKIKENITQSKLELSKSDSETLALNLVSSQDLVGAFAKKIKNTLSNIKDPIAKEEITKILREIQNYSLVHNDHKGVREYMNQVSSDYILKLRYKYPSLNEGEQQICLLIYLKLKNIKIASLLNLSIRSVENKRYSIRKKMNLNTSQSLQEVLMSLNSKN